jgi:hypothetical protein
MVRTENRIPLSEPDPRWQPLADAVFSYNFEHILASGEDHFTFAFRWSDAPAAIELVPATRDFRLIFNDGKIIELPPWQLMNSENLPVRGPAAGLAYNAISTTWGFMLDRFRSAVSDGQHMLFGRFDDLHADFRPIPRDHWCHYHVTDWSTGTASVPGNRQVWNIHTFRRPLVKPPSGRPPVYDQEQIEGEVRRLFRRFGNYGSGKELGWRTRADLEERVAQFLVETVGQSPAKSTLQNRVKKALETIKQNPA